MHICHLIIFLTVLMSAVIQSVAWNLDVRFPSPFSSFLPILSIFSFDFVSTACMFPQQSNIITEVYLWTSLPSVIIFIIGASFYIRSRLPSADYDRLTKTHVYYGKSNAILPASTPDNNVTSTVLLLSYLCLPSVSLKQLQVRLVLC